MPTGTPLAGVSPEDLNRIVAQVTKNGAVCGAAFLVAADLAVTCAHVVQYAGAGPGDEVSLAFPGVRSTTPVRGLVETATWRPPEEEDVAFVTLLDAAPAGARSLPLWSAARTRDRQVRTFGFP